MNKEKANAWIERQIAIKKISIRELARQSELDHSAISKVLNGKREATLDFYIRIALVFGDDAPTELMQEMGIIKPGQIEKMSLFQLWETILKMTPDERQEVENFVDFLTEKKKQKERGVEARPGTNLATGDA